MRAAAKGWREMLIVAAATLAASVAAGQQQPAATSTQTQVVLLGTGTAGPDPERSGPATAIVVNDTAYLVDFGPGIVRRANAAANRKGIRALETPDRAIVISGARTPPRPRSMPVAAATC